MDISMDMNMNMSSVNVNNNGNNNGTMSSEDEAIRILKNIEKLQTIEKELYKELETGTSAGTGTSVTWTKIGQEGSYITVPPNTRVRYGVPGGKWIESVKTGGFIVNNSTMGGDPAVGSGKIVESASSVSTNNNINNASVESIINRINQLSQIRMSLYKSLNYTYKSLQKNVNNTRKDLVDLLTVVSLVEEDLNNAKAQLNQLYDMKNNKMRMVQINTYYGKQYKAQAGLMKLSIFVGVLLLILAILRKSILPEIIANVLLGIVFALGGFFIIRKWLDISRRDNMNFDAYNWQFNPDTQIPTVYDYNMDKLNGLISDVKGVTMPGFNGLDCIGNACCTAGMMYDSAQRKCIKTAAPETFVSGQLTKHCFNGKPTMQKNMMNSNPMPYGDGETINFATF